MKTKVAIIGTAGVPARYGGFETLAHHLVNNLNEQYDLTVYCSNKYYSKQERVQTWNKARLVHVPLNANGMQSIFYDIISIIHALFYADTLLILGVSGGIILPLVKLFTRKKIIVNIDGLEWRRDKWNKYTKWFLHFSEKLAVKYSHADITDNAAIKRYTAIQYKTLSHLIEYGADHCEKESINIPAVVKYPFLHEPYAFKVCRIEPENNIHVVLEAFSQLPNQNMVLVGNWNNSAYGIELKNKYRSFKNLFLLDPIYNQKELNILRSNCSMYIHGHSAGGTNPSLVEAMYLELPVIAFDVSYNRATTENSCLYFKDANELIQVIQQTDKADLKTIGSQLLQIAKRRYTWRIIANKYAYLIELFAFDYTKQSVFNPLQNLDSGLLRKYGLAHFKNLKMFYE